MRLRALLGLSLVALILAACGGTPNPPAPALAWVEISGGGFLLAGAGDARGLSATAFSTTGAAMEDEVIAWETTDASVAVVDQEGNVVAVAGSGVAQITASVGSVRSSPVLVTVGGLAPDAVLLPDEEFTSEPEPVDPSEGLAVGSLITVDVRNASSLSVGDIVVSSGLTPVVGRLSAVSGNTLTLEVVPLDEVFPDLDLAPQSFNISAASVKLSSEVAEYFNSSRTADGAIRLEPKQELTFTSFGTPQDAPVAPQQSGTIDYGPFECEVLNGEAFPLSISLGTHWEYKQNLTLESAWNAQERKLIVHFQPELTPDLRVRAQTATTSRMRCRMQLFESLTPFGGALGFYLGAAVPAGVGFEIGGQLKVPGLGLETEGTISPRISAGFSCQGGDCESVALFEDGGSVLVRPITPDLPDGIEVMHILSAFVFTAIEPGILTQPQPGFYRRGSMSRLLTAEAGRTLFTEFANRTTQALDDLDRMNSNYIAFFEPALRAGSGETSALDLLGLASIPLSVELDSPTLGVSPVTEISLGAIVGFDRGDRIPLTITTTRETLKFLGNDNLVRYEAFILTDDDELIQIANLLPPLGLTRSEFDWVATHNSDDLQRIVVFVTTAFVPDQPIAGRSARIGQQGPGRLELVGQFELSLSGSNTTTENTEELPPPGASHPQWKINHTESYAISYQAIVPVNAFYENGEWTFVPQSWNATATRVETDDVSVVYHVPELPQCHLAEGTRHSGYSGAGIETALGTISPRFGDHVFSGLWIRSPGVRTVGAGTLEWNWPCYTHQAGLTYSFPNNEPSGSRTYPGETRDVFFTLYVDRVIDPADPSTWVGSETMGAATVSWNLILDLP